MYIADKIGDEYKEWMGNVMNWDGGVLHKKLPPYIFISSQTGTGKTYFILEKLLPHIAMKGQKMLYFVNRKILKEQLEQYLRDRFQLPRNSITIMTYQHLEQMLLYNAFIGINELWRYSVVVCDEAHYFLADSTFNTYTNFSYNYIINQLQDKTKIFLSATISGIRKLLDPEPTKREKHIVSLGVDTMYHSNINQTPLASNAQITCKQLLETAQNAVNNSVYIERDFYIYETDSDNAYLNINIISERKQCIDLVIKDIKSKWLIFVDSIKYGKEIEKSIKQTIKQKISDLEGKENAEENKKFYEEFKVRLFSSEYHNSIETVQESRSIAKEEMQSSNVLIATSVMDNGISLKDCNLKNIILIADTEVEFLQMLGRKRREIADDEVNLYIYKYNQEHFKKRKEYYLNLNDIVVGWNVEGRNAHNWLLNSIFSGTIDFSLARKVVYPQNGYLYMSFLAAQHINNLLNYYQHILELFEKDEEYAFVKEQLRWLGWKEEDIEQRIEKWNLGEEGIAVAIINETIEKKINTTISKEENIAIKEKLRNQFSVLVKHISDEQLESLATDGKKKMTKAWLENWLKKYRYNHPISYKQMNVFNQIYNIPYSIRTGDKKGEYIFIEKRNETTSEPTS